MNGRKSSIRITVKNQEERNKILKHAKHLKSAETLLSSVYINKGLQPAIRRKLKRLRDGEKEEKSKPENAGVNITSDWRNRVLLRDGDIIDRYSSSFC